MFLEFYGLREQPFGVTPDPAYLYLSQTHHEALDSLSYGIKADRGFMALIAEPGMGKTTLLYQLLEQLRDSARTVFLFQTQCDSRDFFCYLLTELGVDSRGMGLAAMHNRLNDLLFSVMLAGKRFVVFIDEAQNLSESVLETIRLLSNFETPHAKLLQIILTGQPELAKKLADPRLSQLRQRIAIWSRLKRFGEVDTARYIEHRLQVAGHSESPLFTADALAMIAQGSHGIPRSINNICFNALSLGHDRRDVVINAEIVQEVLDSADVDTIVQESQIVGSPVAAAPVPTSPQLSSKATGRQIARSTAAAPLPASPQRPYKPAGWRIGGSPAATASSRMALRLTYGPMRRRSSRDWTWRAAAVSIVLFAVILLIALAGPLSGAKQIQAASKAIQEVVHRARSGARANPPETHTTTPDSALGAMPYSADPQNLGTGQILTVVASPGQTLREISLRYLGRFDEKLSEEILALNPGLSETNPLEGGQLILLPLPAETLKKGWDTAEGAGAPKGSSRNER